MRIPVAWLREYIDVPEDEAGMQSFADTLTMAGLEVEETRETVVGPTFYAKITPNRGDWASVYGAAREAHAAMADLPLRPMPASSASGEEGTAAQFASVIIEDADNCPRYSATILRGVKIGPTPNWLRDRLTAALGDKYKPISNVVDLTNYVMLELGQPLHAFDLDTLPSGGAIVVRQARQGETIKTLDGTDRALASDMLCICDANHPIAVAGIIGGAETEISDGTVNILLESAHFDPLSVRRTARRLGLSTEASYRFERTVDPALVPVAAARCAALIVQEAGGEIVGTIDVTAKKLPPRRVLARVERIRRLLGADVERDAMIAGLERLGISVERSAGALDCVIPSWRPDLTIEDDIAEEVGRVSLGYANLPETMPPLRSDGGGDSPRGRFTTRVRETLVRAGLQDVQTHSLVAPSDLATPDEAEHRVLIRSALSTELSSLRTSLIPNLLPIAARAFKQGIRDLALFEVGSIYRKDGDGTYREPLRVAGLVAGSAMPQAWAIKPDALPADFYFAKGVAEDLLHAFGIGDVTWAASTHRITHPGRTASVTASDGRVLGLVAELSEATVEAHDLPRRTCIFDFDGDALSRLAADTQVRYAAASPYPAVVRDVAPVFPTSVPYAEIEKAARNAAAGPLLESLRLTDVYEGPNLGEGKRSLTLRFTFRSAMGTLKDVEVEAVLTQVRAALTALGGELRA